MLWRQSQSISSLRSRSAYPWSGRLVAFAVGLTLTTSATAVSADEGQETKDRTSGTSKQNREPERGSDTQADHDRQSASRLADDCLEKLKLSDKQKEQVKEISEKYDRKLESVWKSFGEQYLEAIKLESLMLATIEDHFTDTQRQRIRERRRRTAHHDSSAANNRQADHQQNSDAKTESNKPTDKPTPTAQSGETAKTDQAVKDDLADLGVTLTAEQEDIAENVHRYHRVPLRKLNGQIRDLHIRLLSLESDKLAAIEGVLTEDQLSQLRTIRKSMQYGTRSVARNVSGQKD
jgi:hypothetical protein